MNRRNLIELYMVVASTKYPARHPVTELLKEASAFVDEMIRLMGAARSLPEQGESTQRVEKKMEEIPKRNKPHESKIRQR